MFCIYIVSFHKNCQFIEIDYCRFVPAQMCTLSIALVIAIAHRRSYLQWLMLTLKKKLYFHLIISIISGFFKLIRGDFRNQHKVFLCSRGLWICNKYYKCILNFYRFCIPAGSAKMDGSDCRQQAIECSFRNNFTPFCSTFK